MNNKENYRTPAHYSRFLDGTLNAACGLFWTIAYFLYVRKARQDQSYGMPLVALVLNLAWEFIYTFFWPFHGVGKIFHFPWVFIDGLLLAETIKHGPKHWKDSPLIAGHFHAIVFISMTLALSAQWAFAHQFKKSNANFWSAYMCQSVLSWGSVWMLLTRGHSAGHSMPIWWCRFIGSLAANLRYLYRSHAWPEKYGFAATPFAVWILWTPCIADLIYPFIYNYIREKTRIDIS